MLEEVFWWKCVGLKVLMELGCWKNAGVGRMVLVNIIWRNSVVETHLVELEQYLWNHVGRIGIYKKTNNSSLYIVPSLHLLVPRFVQSLPFLGPTITRKLRWFTRPFTPYAWWCTTPIKPYAQ